MKHISTFLLSLLLVAGLNAQILNQFNGVYTRLDCNSSTALDTAIIAGHDSNTVVIRNFWGAPPGAFPAEDTILVTLDPLTDSLFITPVSYTPGASLYFAGEGILLNGSIFHLDFYWSVYQYGSASLDTTCREYDLLTGLSGPLPDPSFYTYPNPCQNRLFLDHGLESGSIQSIGMWNILGEQVLEIPVDAAEVWVGDLGEGIYLLRVETNEGSISRRIWIE